MVRYLEKNHIQDIAIGSAVLGTGGGGDPYLGKLATIREIEKTGPLKMVTVDELPDDGLVLLEGRLGLIGVGHAPILRSLNNDHHPNYLGWSRKSPAHRPRNPDSTDNAFCRSASSQKYENRAERAPERGARD